MIAFPIVLEVFKKETVRNNLEIIGKLTDELDIYNSVDVSDVIQTFIPFARYSLS